MLGAGKYKVPSGPVQAEIEVMRSRFRATLTHAASKEDAQELIRSLREAHPEASHHCFAFSVGPPGSGRCVGCSDDGEPHNSAGRPILDVLSHADLGDIVCVVTRWFGGTKLGRGRLARAYGDAVQAALLLVEPIEKMDWVSASVELSYGQLEVFNREISDLRVEVAAEHYGANVHLELRLDREVVRLVSERLHELTRGSTSLQIDE